MTMTSAAESKLNARIRPEITVLRSRTSYPRRSRGQVARSPALAVLAGGAEASHPAKPSDGAGADVPAGPVLARRRLRELSRWRRRLSGRRPPAGQGRGSAERARGPGGRRRAAVRRRAGGDDQERRAWSCPRPASCERKRQASRRPHCQPGRRRRRRPAGLRLTRRGKIVVGALLALAVAGLAALIWLAVAGQAQEPGLPDLAPGPVPGTRCSFMHVYCASLSCALAWQRSQALVPCSADSRDR